MAYDFVPYIGSLYDGWTREEILERLAVVDASIKTQAPGAGLIQSASLNGKSISFDNSGAAGPPLSQLRVEKRELMEALALVDDDVQAPTNTTTANMSGHVVYGKPWTSSPCE